MRVSPLPLLPPLEEIPWHPDTKISWQVTGSFSPNWGKMNDCLHSTSVDPIALEIYTRSEEDLRRYAKIHFHHRKKKRRCGIVTVPNPADVVELTSAVKTVDPDVIVWRGNQDLSFRVQNVIKVLRALLYEFFFEWIRLWKSSKVHEWISLPLLRRISSQFLIEIPFVILLEGSHDVRAWGCLTRLIGNQDPSVHSQRMRPLQFSFENLDLFSAISDRATYENQLDRSSWFRKDILKLRTSSFLVLQRENTSSLATVKIIVQELRDHLYLPSWEEFAEGTGKKVRSPFGEKWIRRMTYTFHAELMRSWHWRRNSYVW